MAYILACLLLIVLGLSAHGAYKTATVEKNKTRYIVYMGGVTTDARLHHTAMRSFLDRDANLMTYEHGFLGFSAQLSEEEARSLSSKPGIISVFPDSNCELQTTRSWDFLGQLEGAHGGATDESSTDGTDTIIGFLDSGIWPESESFSDSNMSPVPARWRGTCMEGDDFTSSSCNRKVIGARYYAKFTTPRDGSGHGTHVASTAAGRYVVGASYHGLASGTARGRAPNARVAMYRICTAEKYPKCLVSAILKAFDDAIADGVDVLSLSLGMLPSKETDFFQDPIAIGAFHATERGIIVVCAAGNSGPNPRTVTNTAPWIFTVAATTTDRELVASVLLGSGRVIKGWGINFSNIGKDPLHTLIDGVSTLRYCHPDNNEKLKGSILMCPSNTMDDSSIIDVFNLLQNRSGIIGMIIVTKVSIKDKQNPPNFGIHPIVAVDKTNGEELLSYIRSNSNPTATILPTVATTSLMPAPVVAFFSSRGPTPGIEGLLKPDIAAPGVMILAAWPSIISEVSVEGREEHKFGLLSGTSMACPHVTGMVARVKSQYPTWSPSAIKSAIMTTAISTNNLGSPITTHTGEIATPHEIGAGEMSMSGPVEPGLVYETQVSDYVTYLCALGYNSSTIQLVTSGVVGPNFSCPVNKSSDAVSNMNYPSISISDIKKDEVRTVVRTVTNVGHPEATYQVKVEAPTDVDVQVLPDTLRFTKSVSKLVFRVEFRVSKSRGNFFGSIIWTDGERKVRSPFILSHAVRGVSMSCTFLSLFFSFSLLAW